MIQTQFHTQIQTLRTDNGREYFNSVLGEYLNEHGIIHQSSCVDSPQQNGVSERKNRHLLEVSRALMFTMNVSKYIWGDAILTSAHLINRLPSRSLNFKKPMSILQMQYPFFKPHTLPLKTFGCTAFVHVHEHQRSKLDPRAVRTVFVGYSPTQKGYKCVCPQTKKVFVSSDVTFFENTPYFSSASIQGEKTNESNFWNSLSIPLPTEPLHVTQNPGINLSSPNSTNNSPSILVPEKELMPEQQEFQVYSRRKKPQIGKEVVNSPHCQTDELMVESLNESGTPCSMLDSDIPIALRKGVRSCTQHPISQFVSYSNLSPFFRAFTSNISSVFIPRTVEEAMIIPEWKMLSLKR